MAQEVALIAGVGPGLGLALAEAFAQEGYAVVAAARKASSLVESRNDRRITAVDCDLSVETEAVRLVASAAALGPLRVAVYNAGAFRRANVVDTDAESFEQCWRVGCFGAFLVGRAAARLMLELGTGTMLFTGATASLRGGAGYASLASPKFALRALAQSMARELAPKGIHVAHVIIDGQIRSERYEHLREERGPDSLLEPAAIAQAYVSLHRQSRTAWTHELDLRPWVEKF